MKFVRFFYPGQAGFLLIIVGSIVTVGWLISKSRDKQEAINASKQVTRDLGTVNPSASVDQSVAQKETVISNRSLVPVTKTEPNPAPQYTQVQTPPTKAPQLQTLVSFYTPVVTPTPSPTPQERQKPEIWLPPSMFIPCALVNTVESSHINTPVVGEVTRDCYQNGKLIIPAGTLVSSFAQNGAVRDRIEVAGTWLFVFRDGRQLKVPGMACVREADPTNQQFGIEDGSAGLAGELVESDHWANAKAFLALLITSTTQVATTAANGVVSRGYGGGTVLPDTSSIESKYLDQLLNGETGDGRFVRVRAGTEFYVYPTETVLPTHRTIVNGASVTDPGEQQQSKDPLVNAEREIMQSVQPQGQQQQDAGPKFKY
jgi:hypothetical protein